METEKKLKLTTSGVHTLMDRKILPKDNITADDLKRWLERGGVEVRDAVSFQLATRSRK